MRAIALQWALSYFDSQPEADMVSLETSDGTGHCECAECAKLGSVSDRVFGLANEVPDPRRERYARQIVGGSL